MNNQPISIFYACDDAFVKYTIVSIRSMIDNANPSKKYHIHILHNGIKEDMWQKVLDLQTESFTITFDDVSDYLQSIQEKLPIRDYYSKTTYYRLFIAEMYPELDKAIYIDSDTVVQGDISELYAHDLGNCLVGACHELVMVQVDEYGTYVEKCVGVDRNAFFNAGILLINCEQFRACKVLEQFIELLFVYNFVVTQDEDYLNVICKDRVLWLDQRWNTEAFCEIPYEPNEGKIIHYIMVAKPWHYENCRFGDIFWSYAEKTTVHDEIRAVLANYTDEERKRDEEVGERLMQTAIKETSRPDNYINKTFKNGKDEGRLQIMEKIAQYEREGRFDEDVEDDPPGRVIMPGEVDYTVKKLSSRFFARIAYAAARVYLNSIVKKKKMIVKEIRGSEHLANLTSGAVLTCNHFNAYDSFAMHMAYESSGQQKNRKLFRVIREGNYTSFPGFFGFLMRHFYTLPLSSNLQAMKEMMQATGTVLNDGHFVLIYPEQSMWWNYRKPKPLKSGAFYFAAKNRVPLVPCFITMEDSDLLGEDGFPVQEYTIHISEPILPDPEKTPNKNATMMMERNSAVWKEIYETTYGVPLVYNTSEDKKES